MDRAGKNNVNHNTGTGNLMRLHLLSSNVMYKTSENLPDTITEEIRCLYFNIVSIGQILDGRSPKSCEVTV